MVCIINTKKGSYHYDSYLIMKSRKPDLNRRPTHYECVALPTEPRKLAKNWLNYFTILLQKNQQKISDLPKLHGKRTPEDKLSIFATLVAAAWMFAYRLTSKPCSEITNILNLSSGVLFVGSSGNQLKDFEEGGSRYIISRKWNFIELTLKLLEKS